MKKDKSETPKKTQKTGAMLSFALAKKRLELLEKEETSEDRADVTIDSL